MIMGGFICDGAMSVTPNSPLPCLATMRAAAAEAVLVQIVFIAGKLTPCCQPPIRSASGVQFCHHPLLQQCACIRSAYHFVPVCQRHFPGSAIILPGPVLLKDGLISVQVVVGWQIGRAS